jgi:hypothetical protein
MGFERRRLTNLDSVEKANPYYTKKFEELAIMRM